MSFEILGPVLAVLVIFAALLAFLRFLKSKDKSFTFRVFTALGLGIVLGVGMQVALGRGSDAAKTALDWMSLVGTGYIDLLKMLVMPLVFVASSVPSRARRPLTTSARSAAACLSCCS